MVRQYLDSPVTGSSKATELPNGRLPSVCIVGAGVAGLRCAHVLLNQGFSVTILEARDRIGGKVHQSNKLGYPVDVGPNWIYTAFNNHPIMNLAVQTSTPLHFRDETIRLFDSAGKLVEPSMAERISDLQWNLTKEAFQYSFQHGTEIPTKASLYDFFIKRASELDLDDEHYELLLGMCQMWGNYTGDAVHRQSLKYTWLEVVCGGDEYLVQTTFAKILDKMAEVPMAKADVQLNTKAISFKYRSTNREAGVLEVGIQGARPQKFDVVVVTAPMGWLKANKKAFEPPMTADLEAAIDAISVGHLEKVFITFPIAFWRPAPSSQANSDYTAWISPSYAPSSNPLHWPQEAYDMAAFESPNAHPTLLLYTYGDLSAHISSIVHHNPDEAKQHALLDEFFQPYYSRLPHYDASNPNCKPRAFLATAWQYDELAGYGSYCNLQVGIDHADKHIENIRGGMPERGIWFAGEHASPFEERGTMGGAYLSGDLVASKIIAKYS